MRSAGLHFCSAGANLYQRLPGSHHVTLNGACAANHRHMFADGAGAQLSKEVAQRSRQRFLFSPPYDYVLCHSPHCLLGVRWSYSPDALIAPTTSALSASTAHISTLETFNDGENHQPPHPPRRRHRQPRALSPRPLDIPLGSTSNCLAFFRLLYPISSVLHIGLPRDKLGQLPILERYRPHRRAIAACTPALAIRPAVQHHLRPCRS